MTGLNNRCPACGDFGCSCGLLYGLTRAQSVAMMTARLAPMADHDPQSCICPPCMRWRIDLTDPADLDPNHHPEHVPTKQGASVPRTQNKITRPTSQAGTSTCRLCGVATPPLAQAVQGDATARITYAWPTCKDCAAILARHPGNGLAAVAFASEVLGEQVKPDPGAQAGCVEALPRASLDDTLARHLRRHVTDEGEAVESPSTAPQGQGTERRWQFVTDEDRQRLREAVERHRRAARAKPCTDGVCGVCGVQKAVQWHGTLQFDHPRTGDRWPVCPPCNAMIDKAGGKVTTTRFGNYLAAHVLGLPHAVMDFHPFLPYAQVAGVVAKQAPGCVEPFGYITPEDMAAVYARWPRYAPPEVRDRLARIERATRLMARAEPEPRRAVDLDGGTDVRVQTW